MTATTNVDVIVVGAGAAGLAAAKRLDESGSSTVVLEGRDRIGGRIFTVRDPLLPVPVELGAEFIHGAAEEVVEIVRSERLAACDVNGERWRADHGTLTPFDTADFWARIKRVMRYLDAQRTPDQSFLDFLERKPGGRSLARDRTLAREFVEGFHAADPAQLSERSLANGGVPEDDEERRQGRVLDGYDRVPAALAARLGDRVRLSRTVHRIEWEPGQVAVHHRASSAHGDGASSQSIVARAAIITVPLAVFQQTNGSAAITFAPDVAEARRAAGHLAMGAVVRVALAFSEPFWDSRKVRRKSGTRSLAQLSFLHSTDAEIPVWWTASPLRAPLLIGWAGGPKAERLRAMAHGEVEDRAIRALARQFGIARAKVQALLVRCWHHDWGSDPFTLGAYSYAAVGGRLAAGRLARPIEDTLFFAGEAADTEGRTGTVHGAIGTGYRAADTIARLTSRPKRR